MTSRPSFGIVRDKEPAQVCFHALQVGLGPLELDAGEIAVNGRRLGQHLPGHLDVTRGFPQAVPGGDERLELLVPPRRLAQP